MKIRLTFAALAVIGSLAGAQAQGKMTVADWQKMYDQAEQAFDRKDADSVFSYTTADFKMKMGGHTMTKQESLASMKQWFSMMKTLHASLKVVKATGSATSATVVDNFRNTGQMIDPKTHKPGQFVDVGTETLSWVKIKGKWMIKSLVTNNEKMTLNGKPLPGM
ncbi:MAG TPA: nuclear transport factor 2 family protein [Fimbriimonadaceae bacterium]|nr:nuclear transport factor 2 family protein [Fimbriimonadaceae bacterium]